MEPIFRCCEHDDVEGLTGGLSQWINNLNPPMKNFIDTLFYIAYCNNAVNCLTILLEYGANVNIANSIGRKPLHSTSFYNSKECAEILIDSGADINAKDRRANTPLHVAAQLQSMECMQLLIQSGADINAKNDDGNTPLHEAAYRGSKECMKFLLDYGADASLQNNEGRTFLARIQDETLREEMEEYIKTVISTL